MKLTSNVVTTSLLSRKTTHKLLLFFTGCFQKNGNLQLLFTYFSVEFVEQMRTISFFLFLETLVSRSDLGRWSYLNSSKILSSFKEYINKGYDGKIEKSTQTEVLILSTFSDLSVFSASDKTNLSFNSV